MRRSGSLVPLFSESNVHVPTNNARSEALSSVCPYRPAPQVHTATRMSSHVRFCLRIAPSRGSLMQEGRSVDCRAAQPHTGNVLHRFHVAHPEGVSICPFHPVRAFVGHRSDGFEDAIPSRTNVLVW